MKLLFVKVSSCVFAVCCFFNTSHAQDSQISKFRLSGYGTFSYTVDDRSDIAPMRDFSQKPDDGAETGGTWKLDSRLALQAHYRLSQTVDCVVQGVLRDQVKLNLANSMELAYLAWKPNAWVDIRAGRLSYDAFMMSDTRNLGYAYLWVRPPPEFYAWTPLFSIDGVDMSYITDVGEWQLRFKVQAGISHADVPVGDDTYDVDTRDLYSGTIQGQSGPFRLKAGFAKFTLRNDTKSCESLRNYLGQVAISTSGLFPGISSEAAFLQQNLSFKNMNMTYYTIGAAYDDGTWVGQAEISKSDMSTNLMPHGYMGYVGVGRRFGDWTPYGIFSFARPTYDIYEAQNDWSVIGSEELKNQAILIYNGIRTDQETYSMGLRWDFHNQAAVKLQWNHSRVKPYYGLWWRKYSTSRHPSHINQCTFSLEFIF